MKNTIRMFGFLGLLAVAGWFVSADTVQAQSFSGHGGYGNQGYNRNSQFGGYSGGFNSGYSGGFNSGYSGGFSGGYSGGYNGPVYHQPSVHYDRVFHPTRTHWTPGRGLHTHGHYDLVPHYTPGHYDYQHGNHVHPNPNYHH
jgi:hypothetical protein